MKKLSIITVNYNNCDGLRKTIESVVNQTFRDFEYIIIDGGSTDGSVDVIKEYANKIDYWVSEPDKGIYNAMNKGILKATGEYCNFMNSGDCFYQDDVLEQVLPYYQEDIILGKYKNIGDSYEINGFAKQIITMFDLFTGYSKGWFNHQSTFIKSSLFNDCLFDESLKIVSDLKFLIQALVLKNNSFININIIIANYDTTGISHRFGELFLSEQEQVIKSILPERISLDYLRFSKSDSSLLKLTPLFNNTYGFQKFVYIVVNLLVKIYLFIRKIFPIKKPTNRRP